ncbi:MAG: sigma-70 family RNA polymerase sigma factor [Candidatus Limiplasma sp.]|nr:sigma-70 family RNA polymerase sigma factor [Candidatus Limiplasma sp.]
MEVAKVSGSGQEERLSGMVAQYQALLLKICYAYLCDAEQARDAVQETFLKAYQSMDGFRGECSEKNWLVKIARNTCRDMRRSAWFRHVDKRVTPEDLPEAVSAGASEEERELTAAILRLPDKLKDAVLLYYYQNFSVTETAEILRITQPSVSNRLSRARKKLKAQLEKGDVQ